MGAARLKAGVASCLALLLVCTASQMFCGAQHGEWEDGTGGSRWRSVHTFLSGYMCRHIDLIDIYRMHMYICRIVAWRRPPRFPLPTSLSATSPQLRITSVDGDPPTPGQLCHCSTALSEGECFLIASLRKTKRIFQGRKGRR